jgi:Pyridoxamine 5'-phosphate oxidase
VTWGELEALAPGIARPGRERLDAARVAMLGTLRRDGSPRISPVEPFFAEGELLFGAMAWSLKEKDLRRDSRCVLHSVVTSPDAGEAELKLYGRAREADERTRAACRDGWWVERPSDVVAVRTLAIDEATLVEWDLAAAEMTVKRWSVGLGLRRTTRRYP